MNDVQNVILVFILMAIVVGVFYVILLPIVDNYRTSPLKKKWTKYREIQVNM